MNKFSQCLLGLLSLAGLLFAAPAFANEGVALDHASVNVRDAESLQRGAQTFANYCLSCHSAQAMRYNRLADIGLTEQQIKDNLMFASDKVGDVMKVGMQPKDAKAWLGAAPPDLSVIARSRGADWLYTYMRSFYRDPSRPTGWNNAVFDKVGMPHVLWQLQGDLALESGETQRAGVVRSWETAETGTDGKERVEEHRLVLTRAGELTRLVDGKAVTLDYDRKVADLVNYLVWISEPSQVTREHIGYGVLLFLLFILAPLAYFLKQEYWKDVH
jgi:ubiquinol-cytochrome c reductase cytochrome c1 subunit